MAKITKPDMTYVWASGGSKTAPSNVKIQTGWIVEKPEFEKMNWVQNRQDDSLAYIFQMGVPEWDSAVEYQYSATYKSYVQRNGLVYKALQVGTNKDPTTQPTYWELVFDNYGSAATVQSNLTTHITNYGTLASLSNAVTARTNLGVYSKGEGDARYAALAGISTQLFSVANGTTGYEAVNYSQLDAKAEKNGSGSEVFSVATPTLAAHAVRNDQMLAYLPSGVVVPFAGSFIPTGWLECNGAAVSRTTYSLLFAAIGTLYGIGDGSTTFNLPDLRGEFIRGFDNGRGIDVSRTVGSAQADELKAHNHATSWTMYNEDGSVENHVGSGGSAPDDVFTLSTENYGGTETRPRNIAMYHIIRT